MQPELTQDELDTIDRLTVSQLRVELKRETKRRKELEFACSKLNEGVCQTLGQVLGYPWLKDDQKNFPGAAKEHGVCVGDHVAESIAAEAAERLRELEQFWNSEKS